jgi:hypothetical protein
MKELSSKFNNRIWWSLLQYKYFWCYGGGRRRINMAVLLWRACGAEVVNIAGNLIDFDARGNIFAGFGSWE